MDSVLSTLIATLVTALVFTVLDTRLVAGQEITAPKEAQALSLRFLELLQKTSGGALTWPEVNEINELYDDRLASNWKDKLSKDAFRSELFNISSKLKSLKNRTLVRAIPFSAVTSTNINGDNLLLIYQTEYSEGVFREYIFLKQGTPLPFPSPRRDYGGWLLVGAQIKPGRRISYSDIDRGKYQIDQAEAVSQLLLSTLDQRDDARLRALYDTSIGESWKKAADKVGFSGSLLNIAQAAGDRIGERRLVEIISLDPQQRRDRELTAVQLAFLTQYSKTGLIREEVSLEARDGNWKIIGVYLRPILRM